MPMTTIDADGCPIHVEVEGPEHAPVLMLSNSLGTTLHMWDDQVKPFTEHLRLVRYDRRGHGQSGVPSGPYSIERLGRDAVAIMDGLGLKTVNWCGLSIGGMVGMWLGTNVPQRIDKLILSNTACYMPARDLWDERIKTARERGMAPLVEATLERWFTKEFREREPETMARMRAMVLSTPPEGYASCGEAIRDMDQRETIARIPVPTLIIAGRHDPATTVESAEFIRNQIAGASVAVLDAAHISNMERPDAYARTVLGFLQPT
jgi:3-oxoadipate enol-lactonase